jgi:hypothetical protein
VQAFSQSGVKYWKNLVYVIIGDIYFFFLFSAEDEHDVVWFWLEKGKPHECPVCAQYFEVS